MNGPAYVVANGSLLTPGAIRLYPSLAAVTGLCCGRLYIPRILVGTNMFSSKSNINKNNSDFPSLNGSKRPRTESPPIVQPTYDRFFQIKLLNGSFKEISPFIIHKSLESYFGTLSDTKKLADGSLLIEVRNERQSLLAEKLSKLHSYDVVTTTHPNLNVVKGVITCADLANCSDEEILENLNEQGVTKIFRLPQNKKFPSRKSATFILSFKTHSLPASIKAGWYNIRVRQYIPNPMRCFKCQRFGHLAERCSFSPNCPSCGHQNHGEDPCTLPSFCINCNGEHSPRYKGCPIFKNEFETQKIRVQDKISYLDAKRKFLSQHPSFAQSYSSIITKKKTSIAIQCNLPQEDSFVNPPSQPIPPPTHRSSITSPKHPPQPTQIPPPLCTPNPHPSSLSPPRRMDLSNIVRKSDHSIPQKSSDSPSSASLNKSTSNSKQNLNKSKLSGKSPKSSKESLSSDISMDSHPTQDPNKVTSKISKKKS